MPHTSNAELQILMDIFSRGARTFADVPPLGMDSPILVRIINTLMLTGFDPNDNGCKVFTHLYLRIICVKKYHPDTHIALLNNYDFKAFYRIRMVHDTSNPHRTSILDIDQIHALEYILHCFHTDVRPTTNTNASHFEAQVATYVKDATNIFNILDGCLLAWKSPDYHESPIRLDGRVGKHTLGNTVINRLHGLYNNYNAMKSRSYIQASDTSATCMEPGWIGFCYPPAVPITDKYGVCSYILYMVHVLGTKPNEGHSSSSHFCVDRINNCLHYTVDNVRFTDNATNVGNKQQSNAHYTTDFERFKNYTDQQMQITKRLLHKIVNQNAKLLRQMHN